MTSAEAVDPSSALLFPLQLRRKTKTRREGKKLLITCFVWSESPCKYMNSKCWKSNLVEHGYILLFAYLPAPVVRFQGVTSQIHKDTHFLFSVLFFSFLPPIYLTDLLLTSGVTPPPPPTLAQGHMTREQVGQRAKLLLRPRLHLLASLSLSCWGPCSFSFLAPSRSFPSRLTSLIFKFAPAAFHPP